LEGVMDAFQQEVVADFRPDQAERESEELLG